MTYTCLELNASTTQCETSGWLEVQNPNQDLLGGFIIFYVSLIFTIWFFSRTK